MNTSLRKDYSLEFVRGAAALVVLNWHILLAFFPPAAGLGNLAPHSFKTSVAFVAFNGRSAVFLFFVLSSYVLVKRYFHSRKAQDLLLAALKRLPRLSGPVLVTVMVSCLLFKLDLYSFRDASALSQSIWLSRFGDSSRILSPASANFGAAFLQGVWLTFINGDSDYNSSLWTMKFEFWGSLSVFALAPIIFFLQARSPRLSWVATVAGICLAWQCGYTFSAFAAGLLLHPLLATGARPNAWVRGLILAVSLALLGYAGDAVGIYEPFAILGIDDPNAGLRQACLAIPASIMLVYAVLTMEMPPSWLGGKAARFLGDLSFPIYLVHVPVICSLGSWVLLMSGSATLSASTAFLGSILAALPLMAFNNWWVRVVSALFDKFRLGAPSEAQHLHAG